MSFHFGPKKLYTLSGDDDATLLGELTRSNTGPPQVRKLAFVPESMANRDALDRLLAAAGSLRPGRVAVAMPLSLFDIVTINLPRLTEGTVPRVLPYHLAKAINKPLSSFLYDWQITQRRGDQLQVTVYLLPARLHGVLQGALAEREVAIEYLEPDVFSAFGYLEADGRLPATGACLCLLFRRQMVTLAVFEGSTVTLVRNVTARLPDTPFQANTLDGFNLTAAAPTEPSGTAGNGSPDPRATAPEPKIDATSAEDLLSGFSLLLDRPDQAQEPKEEADGAEEPLALVLEQAEPVVLAGSATSPPMDAAWQDYLQTVNLEIMRTRDFYVSVVKGGAIDTVFAAGADEFLGELQNLLRGSLGIALHPLAAGGAGEDQRFMLAALAAGAGTRW